LCGRGSGMDKDCEKCKHKKKESDELPCDICGDVEQFDQFELSDAFKAKY